MRPERGGLRVPRWNWPRAVSAVKRRIAPIRMVPKSDKPNAPKSRFLCWGQKFGEQA